VYLQIGGALRSPVPLRARRR
jgi:predicted ATP-dependent protease